jgi:hypothetical protein
MVLHYRYRSKTIDDLKGFNYDGYQFDATLSKGIIWFYQIVLLIITIKTPIDQVL